MAFRVLFAKATRMEMNETNQLGEKTWAYICTKEEGLLVNYKMESFEIELQTANTYFQFHRSLDHSCLTHLGVREDLQNLRI